MQTQTKHRPKYREEHSRHHKKTFRQALDGKILLFY